MKTIKSMIAILLAGCIALSLTACHGKDEIALTINDTEIKSALYLNALVECDTEARQRVDEQLAESKKDTESTEETDYFAQELDGMKYVEYVESKAIDRCKEYVFYQELADQGKIKLTDEEKAEAESYADYYWNYYGLSAVYEANGVSLDTYKKAYVYSYYSNAYFQSLYGEGGEKEVKKATIKETMTEKYVLVHTLSTAYTEETTAEQKKAAKSTFKNYVSRLEKGESFETIYKEYNNIKEDPETTTKEDGPKDQYATVLGDEDTSNPSADFAEVFEMKEGEVKLIEKEDDAGYTIYVKLDITDDKYYLENLTDSILYILKQEEFEKHVASKTADFKVAENAYAINRFKVKKIKYPEANA